MSMSFRDPVSIMAAAMQVKEVNSEPAAHAIKPPSMKIITSTAIKPVLVESQ